LGSRPAPRRPAHTLELRAQGLLVLLRRQLHAHQVLRLLGGGALREVDQVDRVALLVEQVGQGLVQRGLAVLGVERHRPHGAAHDGDLAAGVALQRLGDAADVAQRGRHQEEGRARQRQQRDLPGHAALAVAVVVELVHHHDVDRRLGLAQTQVGQHLGGAADDGRGAVDAGVAGHHADALGAEGARQGEELLVDQRLDGAGVVGRLALGQRLEVQRLGHQRLARAGRRVEQDVLARGQLEQGLLLGWIQLAPRGGDPAHEAGQEVVGGQRLASARQQLGERAHGVIESS